MRAASFERRRASWGHAGISTLGLSASASSARGGGFDQFLHGGHGDQEQLDFSLFHLTEIVHLPQSSELLRLPGLRRKLSLGDELESNEAHLSKSRKVLGTGGHFLNQEGALREGLEFSVIVPPGSELCQEPLAGLAVLAGAQKESIDEFAEVSSEVALERYGVHHAVQWRKTGGLCCGGFFARVILHRLELVGKGLQGGEFLGGRGSTSDSAKHPALVGAVRQSQPFQARADEIQPRVHGGDVANFRRGPHTLGDGGISGPNSRIDILHADVLKPHGGFAAENALFFFG